MSGEGVGLIVAIPIVAAGAAIAGMGLAAYGVARLTIAGAKAGVKVAGIIKEEGQKRVDSKATKMAGKLDTNLITAMNQMQNLSAETTRKVAEETEKSIKIMQNMLEQGDAQDYADFLQNLGNESAKIQTTISTNSNEIRKKCENVAAKNIAEFKTAFEKEAKGLSDKIDSLKGNHDAQLALAQKEAKELIEELKELISSIDDDGQVRKYVKYAMSAVEEQLNNAIAHYNKGLYTAALAEAQNGRMAFQEALYEAEVARAERDYAYQMAYTGTEELLALFESQEQFTSEALDYMKKMGLDVDEAILQDSFADYAELVEAERNGNTVKINEFDYMKEFIEDIKQEIEGDSLSVAQMLEYAEKLKGEYREKTLKLINRCVLNMSNRYYRVEYACNFKEFLEEKGFSCEIAVEQFEDPNGPVYVYVENNLTNEEIVYLFTRNNANENVTTVHCEYHMIEGDPNDKEREKYYNKELLHDFYIDQGFADQNVTVSKIECKEHAEGKVSQRANELKKLFNK